ncbi:MAG: tetratricopeptide (TPR) repeat protein [Pseudohongiellaceae bacterium]|jgi:tetratricopeptide (TPR) repeat protein
MTTLPAPRPSTFAKACYVCLPLLLLLLLGEVSLWLLDLGDPRSVPLRGFDPQERFLVDDPAHPGGQITRMFDNPLREVTVPPKGEALRVVLIGGSNTQTFPEALLEYLLEEGDPAKGSWEVLNFGREGFGSGRAGRVLEQSLELDPDVVVVYSGHNEFVELAFERELDALWDAPWQRGLQTALSKLRIYNTLTSALRAPEQDWTELGNGADAPQQLRGLTLLRMPYAETLSVHERYRHNLLSMVEAARQRSVPLVLCTPVANLLSPPQVDVEADGFPSDLLAQATKLRLSAVAKIPARFRSGLRPPRRLRLGSWYGGTAASEALSPEPVPVLRTLTGALAQTAGLKLLKAESVDGAHWPDPAQWDDGVQTVIRTVAEVHLRELSDDERGGLQQSIALLRQAQELTPGSPTVLFDLGLCLYLLGDDDQAAVAALRQAVVLDHAPGMASELSNDIVRHVARDSAPVTLLDSAALFSERCPSGLVGYEVLLDRCHLQPGARAVLMQDMAATLLGMTLR